MPTLPTLLRTAAVLLATALTPLPSAAQAVLPQGVSPEIESAIARGADYLRRTQLRNGSWIARDADSPYPAAMTAFAGMALMAEGSTPTRGRYWRQVRGAVDFLVSVAQPDGLIAPLTGEARPMFGHGLATLFLAQAYGMEEDATRQQQLHSVLKRSVSLIARAQSQLGGWHYFADSGTDEGSVTITQVQALRACRNVGISVPIQTIHRAIAYIKQSANPDGSIRYEANGSGAGQPPITAAAVAVLYNLGRYDDPLAEQALAFARRYLPINGAGNRHHFYSQLYLSQALYQRGGDDWDHHYRQLSSWLLERQRTDGSWVGDAVGSVYGTAIALTVLQLPYALVPIYQR